MGGHSSDGGDVSGGEAVHSGGTSYSERKRKDVNKLIEKRNRSTGENIGKFVEEKTAVGKVVGELKDKHNYKRRLAYAKKVGIDIRDKSESWVLSDSFKNELDKRGYDDYNKGLLSGDVGQDQKSDEQPKVSSQMDNTGVKSDMITADKTSPTTVEMAQLSEEERLKKIRRKGRRATVLTNDMQEEPTLSKKALLS
jgi:hypothetical protein